MCDVNLFKMILSDLFLEAISISFICVINDQYLFKKLWRYDNFKFCIKVLVYVLSDLDFSKTTFVQKFLTQGLFVIKYVQFLMKGSPYEPPDLELDEESLGGGI